MTGFKRLSESGGQDPWLESAAERVHAGDPWALVQEDEARRAGQRALAHVREKTARRSPRALAVAFAVVASTAVFAAAGTLAGRLSAPPPPPPPAQRVAPPPAEVPPASVRSVAEPVAEPPPSPAVVAPAPRAPLRRPVPRALPAAPAAEAPAVPADESPLDAEAKLLLKALHQLRVEHDAAAALHTLDEHDVRFPQGALRDEASAARIEAKAAQEKAP